MTSISFINHASVLISDDHNGILTDPWYEGEVFNKGWKLLIEHSQNEISNLLDKTTHIWISHEHPDHFSPKFFLSYREKIIERKIRILFQNNRDKRVVSFLTKQGFDVFEIADNLNFRINNSFNLKIHKIDFYDSALILDIDGTKIVNLNDCPFESRKDLSKFRNLYGKADILLTQFSYAAWKGGKENNKWRKSAALEKLKIIEKQCQALSCKTVIPFASYIYFANEENYYLNENINRPSDVINHFKNSELNVIFFKPLEIQQINNLKQKNESILFWENTYNTIKDLDLISYPDSIDLELLDKSFKKYQKTIFSKNSFILIWIIKHLPLLGAFKNITIFLYDINTTIDFSILEGLTKIDSNRYDIKLHSQSLLFIFNNEFGFDTLTVNGNFEASVEGFSKITKSLAIGSLNAMGLSISLKMIFDFRTYTMLLKKLVRVKNNMSL